MCKWHVPPVQIVLLWLLTLISNTAGPNRSMRIDVVDCRCWDGAAVNQRQDVLRTLFGNGFVPEKETCRKRACGEAKLVDRQTNPMPCNLRWKT